MKKFSFYLVIFLIIFVAIVVRLRGFDNHFLLASDTGRDILVARAAVATGQIPWVGSFSSAGPFVFGPNWYWQLMIPAALMPNIFFAPWIMMFLISIVVVLLQYLIGNIVGGKKFALLLSLFAALSPIAISLSTYPTQHAMVEIFSTLALLGFVGFLKTGKLRFLFIVSLGIGAALSMHYQGLYLFVYYPVLAIFVLKYRTNIFKVISLSLLGLLVSLWPLLYWDGGRNFKNLEQIIYYFKEGQYRVWVSNRWLLYLWNFLPSQIGKIFGGSVLTGRALELLVPIILLIQFLRHKIDKYIFFSASVLAVQLIGVRYQRGEKYDGYLIFLHPLILFVIGWSLWQLSKISKALFFAVSMVLVITSIIFIMPTLDWRNDSGKLFQATQTLKAKFPGEKFALLGNSPAISNCAYSLSYVLESQKIGSDNGRPIGICKDSCNLPKIITINYQNDSCVLVDLETTNKDDWQPFSLYKVYDDVQNWWKK